MRNINSDWIYESWKEASTYEYTCNDDRYYCTNKIEQS